MEWARWGWLGGVDLRGASACGIFGWQQCNTEEYASAMDRWGISALPGSSTTSRVCAALPKPPINWNDWKPLLVQSSPNQCFWIYLVTFFLGVTTGYLDMGHGLTMGVHWAVITCCSGSSAPPSPPKKKRFESTGLENFNVQKNSWKKWNDPVFSLCPLTSTMLHLLKNQAGVIYKWMETGITAQVNCSQLICMSFHHCDIPVPKNDRLLKP